MDPGKPIPSFGPATLRRLQIRAIFARLTAAKYPTPNTELQASLAVQAARCCKKAG